MTKLFTKTKRLSFLFCLLSFQINAQFSNVSSTAGISMVHDGESVSEFMDVGSGAAWFDLDNDGDQDLYMTMRTGANYLYKNNGDGTFTDIASTANAQDASGDGAGVAAADFNNDGWVDLYLANGNEDVLLKNNGDETFTDITTSSGLISGNRRGTSASWGDYDADGFLDLFVSHHRPVATGAYDITEVQDFLFHNNGNETFTDVSSLLGISHLQGHGFIGGWTDYDRDGDADLILINDCIVEGVGAGTEGTKVFRNDGGTNGVSNWNFTEVGHSIGIVDPDDPSISDCRNGMGLAVGDYNRDGYMDFYYTNIGHVVLFENDGDGTFTDVSSDAEVDIQAAHYFSWGASFVDYDMDGYQDIMTAIGSLDIPAAINPQPNMLFKNNGDDTFSEVAASLGIDDPKKTRHIVYADYDNDGDLDFLVHNYGENPMLMENTISNSNHYLIINLEGVESNKDGIGSKLKLTLADGTIQYFETRSGSNLGGGDATYAYFGLGSNTTATELEITWPSGIVQVVNNINADQSLDIAEDSTLPIELSYFEAKQKEENVLLEWATLSEIDNAYFSIQRSADGRAFNEIGRIQGAGTSAIILDYEFVDEAPLSDYNYYRIHQIDFDGKSSFSEVKSVRFESTLTEVNIIPNPINKETFVLNYQGSEEEVNFEIFDLFGRLVNSGIIQNKTNKEISITGLSNGMYIMRLSGEQVSFSDRMIINQ